MKVWYLCPGRGKGRGERRGEARRGEGKQVASDVVLIGESAFLGWVPRPSRRENHTLVLY